MQLNKIISKKNFISFLWHATFLALAQNFMDIDTIIPAMLIDSGGKSIHVGFLTAILLGGSSFSQILFLPILNNHSYKKKFLLAGINSRILALFGLGLIFFLYQYMSSIFVIWLIFIFISIFSFSGAFANISYTDILGKSILQEKRKKFFSAKQIIASIGVLISAFMASKILAETNYPNNYSYLFIIAASFLLIASLGFWNIKEIKANPKIIKGLKQYFNTIITEIKINKRLRVYLLMINTLGISLSLLPFLMLYAKDIFDVNSVQVGNYLLFKVAGGVITGALMFYFSGKSKYRILIYFIILLAMAVSLMVIISNNQNILFICFFLGGIMFSLYQISISGILLEITTNENRAFYTGIAGAGNVFPAIFPILGGYLIRELGFKLFFMVLLLIISFTIYFNYRLNCSK